MAMTVRKRKARASKRNAARAARNALAREAASAIAEERQQPKRERSRHKSQLEILESRGAINHKHRSAGERLERDYRMSGTLIGKLVASYDPDASVLRPSPGTKPDTPTSIRARERYDHAMAALSRVSPWLSGVAVHVAILDEPVSRWGALNGRAKTDGVPVLLIALDALCAHYAGERRLAA